MRYNEKYYIECRLEDVEINNEFLVRLPYHQHAMYVKCEADLFGNFKCKTLAGTMSIFTPTSQVLRQRTLVERDDI